MSENGVKEIPPAVQGAIRRLREDEDFSTLIQWAAAEHGVGEEEFQESERLGLFMSGQRRSITFLAEIVGVDLVLVRGRELKAKANEEHDTEK